MSSDEVDKKSDEETKETGSSAEEDEMKDEGKAEKTNSKAAPKKKAAEPPKIKQPAKKRVKTEQAEKETTGTNKKEEKKKAQKEKEEEEPEEDDDDLENHKDVPLLDQPLEITGNRKRKEVQRFTPVAKDEQEKKEVKIPDGRGKALGEMETVEAGLQRAKPEDLKLLHRLCFGKPGQKVSMKKFLKKFNGWDFEEGSDDFEKKKAHTRLTFKKVTVSHLKNLCLILDIERSGTKDDLLDRILSYLVCPVDSGKKLPQGRSKRKGAVEKNYDEGDEKFEKKDKKKGSPKKKDDGSEESENDEEPEKEDKKVKQNNKNKGNSTEDSEPEEEEEEAGEEEEVEEVKKPKKAPTKKGKKAAPVAEKKAPPKKRAAAKKVTEKTDSEGAAEGDDESESEEPNVKKAKNPPTDEEIKTYVKSLLDGANLELITMKKVCQDVYAHYPEFDLSSRKDFIKTTVKNLISS